MVKWDSLRNKIAEALHKYGQEKLEEAARVAETRFDGGGKWHGKEIATAIRKLGGKE